MTGYSSKPLVDKLGIKPGTRIAIVNAPRGYRATLGVLPSGVTVSSSVRGTYPFVHFFTRSRALFQSRLGLLLRALERDGVLWVSWPKKSSGVETDVTEDVVREVALPLGLVDVKVAAVDDIWSGLKLVRRVSVRERIPNTQ
jgi:hypothetical protein